MGFAAEDAAHTTYVTLRRPGFVSDRYLNALTAETSITTVELCLAGLWDRTTDGYRVADADTLSVALQIHGRLTDLASRCVGMGGHVVDPGRPQRCSRCGSSSGDGPGPGD